MLLLVSAKNERLLLPMSKIYTLDAHHVERLPSPKELKAELPITSQQIEFVTWARKQICSILSGEDPRLLLIVGPCSIHDRTSAYEYAERLKSLSQTVSKSFFIIMRTYFEKPRTGLGWKGMLYDPHLNETYDLSTGLRQARSLLLELASRRIPAATEFLDPVAPRFFGDLISWACIGARTAESQIHRQFASGLPMPIAFKNSTSGSVGVAVNGVLSAMSPHTFFGIDDSGHISTIRTKGNPYAHVALRGGEQGPNYDEESIGYALKQLQQAGLPQRLIVDCSHDNSSRNYEEQSAVFQSVIQQYMQGNQAIRGIALESHLFAGNQRLSEHLNQLRYAVSLTDPCMDWKMTEELVLQGAQILECKNGKEASVSESISVS